MKGHAWKAFLLLFLLGQCARETTIDLPEAPPRTVVICHFKPGEPFYLEISRSKSVFDGADFETVEEADATLSVEGKLWNRFRFGYDTLRDRYIWKTKLDVLPETPFTLTVRLPLDENAAVEATSIAPKHYGLEPLQFDTAAVRTVQLPDGSFALRVPLLLKLNGLPDTGRYFAFSFSHETNVYRLVNQQLVQDYTYIAPSSFTTDGRTLSLLNDLSQAEQAVLINEKFWDDGATAIRLDAIVPFFPDREKPRRLFVEWRTLSKEFYRYHLSLARQGANLPLSDPDAVFNNVSNGYGNFSGYSVGTDTLDLR